MYQSGNVKTTFVCKGRFLMSTKDNSNKRFWQMVAKLYTTIIEKRNKSIYNELCNEIGKRLINNMQVLELACGTGQLTFSLSEKVHTWEATDFSDKMIAEAIKRNKSHNINFAVQDATDLQYAANKFDVVVIANALHIMPRPEVAFAEIKRVLKQDGLMIAPTFVYDGQVNKLMVGLFEKVGFRTFHKWTSRGYRESIENNGFKVEDMKTINGNLLPECLLFCKP